MAAGSRGTGGSFLAGVAARRRQVQGARRTLSMGQERGAPQAPRRAIPNMPPQRVPSGRQAPPPPTQAAPAPQQGEGDQRERMLARVQEFFSTIQRPGAQPAPEAGIEDQALAPEAVPLSDQVSQLGATGLSPEQQFYRLSGRLASPREMAVYRTTMLLEQQLNRRPTANELRAALMRPASLSASFPVVVGP